MQGMRELGFATVESQANFVWSPHPNVSVKPLYERLKANQILVRYMNYPRWGDGLRVSVGSDEQVDACVSVLKSIM
jgi:histidinol-phosphate aminotransferase